MNALVGTVSTETVLKDFRSDHFEKGTFGADVALLFGLRGALDHHQKHRERIRNKLEDFLPAQEARETATQVYNSALDVDEEIGRVLKDPLVGKLYEYDGRFFVPRGTRLFYTAFDGFHLLQSLTDSILETFFCGRGKRFAIPWLLEEVGKHAWLATIRRIYWEESGTLSVLPKEVLDEIIKDMVERRRQTGAGPPPMSAEEQVFFQFFEEEMRKPDEVSKAVGL